MNLNYETDAKHIRINKTLYPKHKYRMQTTRQNNNTN